MGAIRSKFKIMISELSKSIRSNLKYLGGASGLSKVRSACHFMHLTKIAEMKSISKPRLPIEIYTCKEIFSTDEFSNHDKA